MCVFMLYTLRERCPVAIRLSTSFECWRARDIEHFWEGTVFASEYYNNVRGDIIHGGTVFTPTPGNMASNARVCEVLPEPKARVILAHECNNSQYCPINHVISCLLRSSSSTWC